MPLLSGLGYLIPINKDSKKTFNNKIEKPQTIILV